LERIRKEQESFPDQRLGLERELSLIQTRLHHLVELIPNGKGTDAVINSLHHEEARKKAIIGELARLDRAAQVVSIDAKCIALTASATGSPTTEEATRRTHYV
jgi:hypothetical protein